MDDLSFEEFEIEYKYLKAVIEGGLEKKPDNVLIYATSNRRHLIRETFKDKEDRDDMVLFNDFNTGGYLEFRGYKTYIDPRADSFVLEANHDFDYLTESKKIQSGHIFYKDFIDKYDFTHFIIQKNLTPYLDTSLEHDDDYEKLFENEEYVIYKTK